MGAFTTPQGVRQFYFTAPAAFPPFIPFIVTVISLGGYLEFWIQSLFAMMVRFAALGETLLCMSSTVAHMRTSDVAVVPSARVPHPDTLVRVPGASSPALVGEEE